MIKIRPYQEKDKKEIKELAINIIQEIYNINPKKIKRIQDLDNIKDYYTKFYVANDKNKIIGMAGLKKHKEKIGRLKRMYINRKYRNKGLGKKLVRKIETYAKNNGFKKIILGAYSKNSNALRFYEKLGYKEYKKIKMMRYLKKEIK